MAASGGKGKRSRNFTHEETAVLLEIWSDGEFQRRFESSYRNSFLWVDIARHMQKRGFERDGNECKNKIRNLKTEYLRLKRSFTAGSKPPDWLYWEKLHSVFGAKTEGDESTRVKLEPDMTEVEGAANHESHSPGNTDQESEDEEYGSPLEHVQPILEDNPQSPNDDKKSWYRNGTGSGGEESSNPPGWKPTQATTGARRGSSSSSRNGVKRNRNFSHQETLRLLAIWGEGCIQDAFRSAYRHSTLWATIARLMKQRGYDRDANECKVKVGNLRSEYQRIRRGWRGVGEPDWPYWDSLHGVLGSKAESDPEPVKKVERPPRPPRRRRRRRRSSSSGESRTEAPPGDSELLKRLVEIEERSFRLLQKRTENEALMTSAATKFFSSTMHFLMSYTSLLFAQSNSGGNAQPMSSVASSPPHFPTYPEAQFANSGFPMSSCAMASSYGHSFPVSPPPPPPPPPPPTSAASPFQFSAFPIAPQFQFQQHGFPVQAPNT